MKLENEFAPKNNDKNGLDLTSLLNEYLGTYKYLSFLPFQFILRMYVTCLIPSELLTAFLSYSLSKGMILFWLWIVAE